MKKSFAFPWHTLLFAIFPVITLLANNVDQVDYSAAYRPLILSLVVCAGLLVLAKGVLGDWQKAGLLVTVISALFFSYGHVFSYLEGVEISGMVIGRHRVLGILWVGLMVLAFWWAVTRKGLQTLTTSLNVMSLVLLVFPLYSLARYQYTEQTYADTGPKIQNTSLRLPEDGSAPDIYFIVLDAYGRKDVLQETFGLDNSQFLRELKDLGFYVVECSQSNYARTKLSVTSTLNMDYIQNLIPAESASGLSAKMEPYFTNNQVRLLLEELGYQTIVFDNGYPWLKWKHATYYLEKGGQASARLEVAAALTPFEELFLRTTLLRAPIDMRLAGAATVSSAVSHRETVLYMLETLPQIPKVSGPKLVYAHLTLPHPPFIFGANGEKVFLGSTGTETNDLDLYSDKMTRIGYRDQTIYTNKLIIPILRTIIQQSRVPPIIVLESDHGPTSYGGLKNRMANLMAYYLPGKDGSRLAYPSITPVNSFRLVFNTYFGGKYPFLEDVSYFSVRTATLNYEIVPNTCAGH